MSMLELAKLVFLISHVDEITSRKVLVNQLVVFFEIIDELFSQAAQKVFQKLVDPEALIMEKVIWHRE